MIYPSRKFILIIHLKNVPIVQLLVNGREKSLCVTIRNVQCIKRKDTPILTQLLILVNEASFTEEELTGTVKRLKVDMKKVIVTFGHQIY